ncbi:MAG: DNA polymerase III subunit epsilon, partial [Rubrivivax sp.]|nr:DNA polymerase III subunit epsilon [Rubrivivax sp.]
MNVDRQELAAAVAPGALLAVMLGATAGLLAVTLEGAQRAMVWDLLQPRLALVFMLWLVLAIAAGTAARRAWHHFAAAPGRLAEGVQVLISSAGERQLPAEGSRSSRALALAVNTLAQQRDS